MQPPSVCTSLPKAPTVDYMASFNKLNELPEIELNIRDSCATVDTFSYHALPFESLDPEIPLLSRGVSANSVTIIKMTPDLFPGFSSPVKM